MQSAMATLGMYTVAVLIVVVLVGILVHYSAAHFSENLRKLIIISSFFLILGISTRPFEHT